MYRSILNLELVGGEWSASRPCRFNPREKAPGTHWIGDSLGPRAGLDDVQKRKFFDSKDTRTLTSGLSSP
jgi:hypothetical protein